MSSVPSSSRRRVVKATKKKKKPSSRSNPTETADASSHEKMVMPKMRKKKDKRQRERELLGLSKPDENSTADMEDEAKSAEFASRLSNTHSTAKQTDHVDDTDPNDGGGDYGDDFEDYDDDFEGVEDGQQNEATPTSSHTKDEAHSSTRNTITKAEETKHNDESKQSQQTRRPSSSSYVSAEPESNMTDEAKAWALKYESIEQFERVDRRQRGRVRDLRSLCHLEEERSDLFEMHSMEAWDYYVQAVGQMGLVRQASSQTGEDAREIGTQCEVPDTQDFGMSFPCFDSSDFEEFHNGGNPSETENETQQPESSRALQTILRIGDSVCALLDEEESELYHTIDDQHTSSSNRDGEEKATEILPGRHVFPGESVKLGPTQLPMGVLDSRSLVAMSFSATNANMLLSVHGPRSGTATFDQTIASECILNLWDILKPTAAICTTPCRAAVTACALSTGRRIWAICGTKEGSLSLWDLGAARQVAYSGSFPSPQLSRGVCQWSTDVIVDDSKSHMSPICDVKIVDTSGSSLQVVSVDTQAVTHVWTLTEFATVNHDPVSRLVHVARLEPSMRVRSQIPPTSPEALTIEATCLGIASGAADQIYVGTAHGSVCRLGRYGTSDLPDTHEPAANNLTVLDALRAVTAIDFSPFVPWLFLVGYSDGTISLFSENIALPVRTWGETTYPECDTSGAVAGISSLKWAPSRAASFFVSDSCGHVYGWDLLKNDMEPMYHQEPRHESEAGCGVIETLTTNNGAALAFATVTLATPSIQAFRYSLSTSARARKDEVNHFLGALNLAN